MGGRLKKPSRAGVLQDSLPLIYLQSIKCHSFGISNNTSKNFKPTFKPIIVHNVVSRVTNFVEKKYVAHNGFGFFLLKVESTLTYGTIPLESDLKRKMLIPRITEFSRFIISPQSYFLCEFPRSLALYFPFKNGAVGTQKTSTVLPACVVGVIWEGAGRGGEVTDKVGTFSLGFSLSSPITPATKASFEQSR